MFRLDSSVLTDINDASFLLSLGILFPRVGLSTLQDYSTCFASINFEVFHRSFQNINILNPERVLGARDCQSRPVPTGHDMHKHQWVIVRGGSQ